MSVIHDVNEGDKMVPFPYDNRHPRAEASADFAARALQKHPDGKGLILPPVKKETVEGTNSIWTKIAGSASADFAFPGNSTHYGLFRYYIRTWGILGHRLSVGAVDELVDRALKHDAYPESTEGWSMQFYEWKRVDVKKAVEDAKNFVLNGYRFRDLPVEKRKQMAKELEVLIPVAAEVAGLIGEHAKKVARHMEWRYEDKYKNATTAEAFMDYLISEGDPRLEIWQKYGPEEIKKIHKLHRLLYELTKPVSRVVFERPSGVEDLLDEREKEEVEREVQELLKGVRGEVRAEIGEQEERAPTTRKMETPQRMAESQTPTKPVIQERRDLSEQRAPPSDVGNREVSKKGEVSCVRNLLKPAEVVIQQGRDVTTMSFSEREKMWREIEENYNRYLNGECGGFLGDSNVHFRSEFEGALAILAWSFWRNGETFDPAGKYFGEKEITAVDRILRYEVFDMYTKEGLMKMITRHDSAILALLKEYYKGFDRWVDETLADPEVSLFLRTFLKERWNSYKMKINEVMAEAIFLVNWFRDFLLEKE